MKIQTIFDSYKRNFPQLNKNERYKWEGLKWYKSHWDIDAEDFASMLENALKGSSNLLASRMYFPYRMICQFAQREPETVRKMFKTLYDESIPLGKRYDDFRKDAKRLIKIKEEENGDGKKLNHYQDLHAISVYLTFEYPEKYFIYKYKIYVGFSKLIGFKEEKVNGSAAYKRQLESEPPADLILSH